MAAAPRGLLRSFRARAPIRARQRRRSMRTFAGAMLLIAGVSLSLPGAALAQTLPHESELNDASFPPLPLEPEIVSFPDPYFALVGQKIQLGLASLQERRWWYRVA